MEKDQARLISIECELVITQPGMNNNYFTIQNGFKNFKTFFGYYTDWWHLYKN